MAQIAADGGFLEWKLGRPFEPSPDRFEPTKRASEHLLRQRAVVSARNKRIAAKGSPGC